MPNSPFFQRHCPYYFFSFFFWLEFYRIRHLVFKFPSGGVHFRGSWARIDGGCPGAAVSLLSGPVCRAVALGARCRVSTHQGVLAEYVCRLSSADPASNLLCTLLWSLTLSRGRNQPSNSFPSAFEALSWDSSLLAAVQHRIVCSRSLASSTVLCSCSHWFPSILVKILCVCVFYKGLYKKVWNEKKPLSGCWVHCCSWLRAVLLCASALLLGAGRLAGAEILRWAQRSFVESQYSVLGQSVVLDGHGK